VSDPRVFDPERLLVTLAGHGVRYVLVGALAARLQGFPRLTADADITPERERSNLERLAAALRELDARVYTEPVPEGLDFDCSAATLERADLWNLVTAAGRVDIVFQPAGTEGYPDLAADAVRYEAFGVEIAAACRYPQVEGGGGPAAGPTGRRGDPGDASAWPAGRHASPWSSVGLGRWRRGSRPGRSTRRRRGSG